MGFKIWSDSSSEIKILLKPLIEEREWSDLNKNEKHQIWKHLERYLFDKNPKKTSKIYGSPTYYHFYNDIHKQSIIYTIHEINKKYKIKCYTPNYLEKTNIDSICIDFINIFDNGESDIVLEMMSIYCDFLIKAKPQNHIYKQDDESDQRFEDRKNENQYKYFDLLSQELNEVFLDYGLNLYLTREGWIPRQEEKIIKDIYEPVIKCLSNGDYKEVERDLSDAFEDYSKKDYSGSITKGFSALQGFLQIKVNGQIGKGDFAGLIKDGIKKGIISNDIFINTIFKDIESIIARYRQENADSHPKLEYANEKSAQLFLNLIMVFIQHCMQK